MDLAAFRKSVHDFVEMTERNEFASNAESSFKNFLIFSPLQLFDNWWHCRCYIAIIRTQLIQARLRISIAGDCEIELAYLLSLVRIGAGDPLPWVPVVDFVLRKMWRQFPEALRSQPFMRDVFNELALFSHGAVVNASPCAARKVRRVGTTRSW